MSTKYVCYRCNKEFTVKCNFQKHLNRKNPCVKEELKMKDLKIQILQDMFMKKQKQATYEKSLNVIYVLTTDAHKKDRTYIIGKAKNLQKRLSTYNKTLEHEVVYYKECNSEETMGIVETMVLTKLKQYKEKANRDRFILPHDKDISFFTQIISDSIHFFSS